MKPKKSIKSCGIPFKNADSEGASGDLHHRTRHVNGMPHDFMLFFGFILLLSIMMVASPGVPGGSIMAALAPLASVLDFDSEAQALMIALYIAMDSFGTACNVTGDGAVALIVEKVTKNSVEE